MPESWLHSHQGLATLAIYSEISCNTNYLYTDRQPGKQSIVIKNDASLAVLKSEGGKATGVIRSEGGTATSVIRSEGGTATKELNYEDSQIDSKTSKTINHKRLRSSTGGLNGENTKEILKNGAEVFEDITKTQETVDTGRGVKRMIFTGHSKRSSGNLQERLRWFLARRKYRFKKLKPASSHGSFFLNGLLKGRADRYEWHIERAANSPLNRPVSLIVPASGSDHPDFSSWQPPIQRVRIVERIIGEESTEVGESGGKGLEDLRNLEKVMLLQEVQDIRQRSRKSLMEPISEEENIAFSNAAYTIHNFGPDYENLICSLDLGPELPEYENVIHKDALYENEEFQHETERESEEIYESYDRGEDCIYQEIYFGEKENEKSTEGRIQELMETVQKVNRLVSKPNLSDRQTKKSSFKSTGSQAKPHRTQPSKPNILQKKADSSKVTHNPHSVSSVNQTSQNLNFGPKKNILGQSIKKGGVGVFSPEEQLIVKQFLETVKKDLRITERPLLDPSFNKNIKHNQKSEIKITESEC